MIPTRIVIYATRGVIQSVESPDDPEAVIVILADYDWEGMDGDDKPVGYYPVTPISEQTYKEYLNGVDQTVDQLTGMEMANEKVQPHN